MKIKKLDWIDEWSYKQQCVISSQSTVEIRLINTNIILVANEITIYDDNWRLSITCDETKTIFYCASLDEAKTKAQEVTDAIITDIYKYIADVFFDHT